VEQGYTVPTPIQAQAIPIVLSGRDLLGAAQTGTGKTAGFTLPLLQRLAPMATKSFSPALHPVRCLILTPTRELAIQVHESVKTYGKHIPLRSFVVYGGVNINPQIEELKRGVEILVATPGRLLDLVGQKAVNLGKVQILVLDEADRMLDMGFIPDIKRIIALLPAARQTLLFSATFSDEIRKLASQFQKDPATVEVARRNTPAEAVTQYVYHVDANKKRELLSHLVRKNEWEQVLVFTKTKHGANRLASQLQKDRINAATGCLLNYTQAWPSATELDTFLYARGGVPWRCTISPPSGVLSTPGLFTVGPCYQQCIVNSCPSAGALLDRQEQCAAANCPAECPGAGCQACVAAKCQAEVAACQSASSCE